MSPRAPWFKAVILVLLAVMLMTGCTGARGYTHEDGKVKLVRADGGGADDGLQVRGRWGNAYGFIVVLLCVCLIFVVIADLIILPLTWGYYDRPFYCTQEVVVVIRD